MAYWLFYDGRLTQPGKAGAEDDSADFAIMKPRYSKQILPVPWHLVISRFCCTLLDISLHTKLSKVIPLWVKIDVNKIIAVEDSTHAGVKRKPENFRLAEIQTLTSVILLQFSNQLS